ncbi:hypothetical protein [Sphingomonas sp.]|uniref:hypothetical protein n=1 Tax=Sphingomonas sp. TaxID=28214 RepID=UPI0028B0A5F3|nr:hypothetical protein [Sphingomonas sp.]
MPTSGRGAFEHAMPVLPAPVRLPGPGTTPAGSPPILDRNAGSDALTAHAAIVSRAQALLLAFAVEETRNAPLMAGTQSAPAPAPDIPGTRDLFARILVADALLDRDLDARHPAIETTIRQIVRHRRAVDRARPAGADRYHDLSGDVDELAQILLLFARLSRRDLIATHCAPPLAVLLAYAEADGVLPTWILLSNTAPDTAETVASLVYALARWDARRFLGMIVAGARWVADRQQPDGSWAAVGADPLYGTWLALRLLGAVMPNHPAVSRGARFLHSIRRGGLGWGADGDNPLATALAVLALKATRIELPPGLATEAHAVLAPVAGGWRAQPLLRFSRTAAGPPLLVDHGCRVLTAAFALKASTTLEAGCERRFTG